MCAAAVKLRAPKLSIFAEPLPAELRLARPAGCWVMSELRSRWSERGFFVVDQSARALEACSM